MTEASLYNNMEKTEGKAAAVRMAVQFGTGSPDRRQADAVIRSEK